MNAATKAIAAQGLARRAFSLGAVKAFDQALQFLLPVVLVRCLDGATFGEYRLLWLAVGTVMALATLGMPGALYYFLPRSDAPTRRLYIHQTLAFLATTGLLAALIVSPLNPWLPATLHPLAKYGALVPAFVALWVVSVLLDFLPTIEEHRDHPQRDERRHQRAVLGQRVQRRRQPGIKRADDERGEEAGGGEEGERLVDVEPARRGVRARQEVVERARHAERGERHHRTDGEPQQAVLAKGGAVEAAHQHHRQQELQRLVERLDRAKRERSPRKALCGDGFCCRVHSLPWFATPPSRGDMSRRQRKPRVTRAPQAGARSARGLPSSNDCARSTPGCRTTPGSKGRCCRAGLRLSPRLRRRLLRRC